MRLSFVFLMLLVLPAWAKVTDTRPKPRVLVLTDIENEPDDTQSLIRFLLYANQWDIEGLIATTSVHQQERVAPEKIREVVTAYGQVRANLALHEPGYPEAAQLLGLIRPALPRFGRQAVGPGNDSPGSDLIIQVVDKNDERPVWVLSWGGPNCLAQALWKVSMTRSAEELNRFIAKLRVYTISDQDDSGPWLRKTFPSLFYVASPGVYGRGAYHYATWNGISGDRHHGRFTGADFSLVDNPWLDVNIRQGHGPLGALYPLTKYLMEGDTPSFLHLIDNGLNVPEHPDYGGWGGRYEYYQPRTRPWFSEPETRPFFTDADDEVKGVDGHMHRSNQATIWRWRQAYQHDFAARMDWCVKPFSEANHPPRVVLNHPAALNVTSGEPITLNARGSTDPDGNSLTYNWLYYPEAGTYLSHRDLVISQPAAPATTLTAPDVSKPETLHFIVSVTDNGSPALTRYQRVLVTVLPKNR